MDNQSTRILSEIIQRRRTRKPAQFSPDPPSTNLITKLIDIARHAPNHHRTEPARFYLLNQKIQQLGKLFGETLAGKSKDPLLVEKGEPQNPGMGRSALHYPDDSHREVIRLGYQKSCGD